MGILGVYTPTKKGGSPTISGPNLYQKHPKVMGDPHMSIRNHQSHQPRFAHGFPKKHETVTIWVWNLPSSYEFIDADPIMGIFH